MRAKSPAGWHAAEPALVVRSAGRCPVALFGRHVAATEARRPHNGVLRRGVRQQRSAEKDAEGHHHGAGPGSRRRASANTASYRNFPSCSAILMRRKTSRQHACAFIRKLKAVNPAMELITYFYTPTPQRAGTYGDVDAAERYAGRYAGGMGHARLGQLDEPYRPRPALDGRSKLQARVEDFELVLKSRFPSVHDRRIPRPWSKACRPLAGRWPLAARRNMPIRHCCAQVRAPCPYRARRLASSTVICGPEGACRDHAERAREAYRLWAPQLCLRDRDQFHRPTNAGPRLSWPPLDGTPARCRLPVPAGAYRAGFRAWRWVSMPARKCWRRAVRAPCRGGRCARACHLRTVGFNMVWCRLVLGHLA